MKDDLLDQDPPVRSGNASPAVDRRDSRPSPQSMGPLPANKVRILRLPQVCNVTGYGRSMIYQMEAEHRFPMRVKLGARAVGWLEEEVQVWLRERIESSRSPGAQARLPSSAL